MYRWRRSSKAVTPTSVVITYTSPDTDLTIESRKRYHVSHCGIQSSVKFVVMEQDVVIGITGTLREAQRYAEEMDNAFI